MSTESRHPAIIVHGGAGPIKDDSLAARLEGCREAALAGWTILERGGSSVDAVEAAVVALEDNPLFNAGTGSTLNRLGKVEMDAAIMSAQQLRAGAVGAVSAIKNPIKLARHIMEDGRHVMLAGEGAISFAREIGFPECAPESLLVEKERAHWESKHGTVGCVALDSLGALAVATSTGGIFDKLPGRVGDSPLIGCGTYADDDAAVSCTGYGEAIIRVVLAKSTVDLVRTGMDVQSAVIRGIELLHNRTGANGGLICIGSDGKIGYARNTTHMPICWISNRGTISLDS